MANKGKQCADSAQTGPGTKVRSVGTRESQTKVGLRTGASGETQGASRGKQGRG